MEEPQPEWVCTFWHWSRGKGPGKNCDLWSSGGLHRGNTQHSWGPPVLQNVYLYFGL